MAERYEYEHFDPTELILRDHLAIDRTMLANHRTLLAYIRTAMMLFVSGVTVLKLFVNTIPMVCLGVSLIAAGVVVAFLGSVQFAQMRQRISRALRPRNDNK